MSGFTIILHIGILGRSGRTIVLRKNKSLKMLISVIIPLYNCEKYIEQAVKSVQNQRDIYEIIVVDDAYPDKAFEICKKLAKADIKIKLYKHSDGKNHGAGASRNLGIEKANAKYIAFLDADDYYLENRFERALEIMEGDQTVDGVYEAIGSEFYDKEGENRYQGKPILTTLKKVIPSEELFESMGPIGNLGHFSCNGLTVRAEVFDRVGNFSTFLKLSQDTHLFMKMAMLIKLVPGNISFPVAIRGVHEGNRSQDSELLASYRIDLYEDLLRWAKKRKVKKSRLMVLANKCLIEARLASRKEEKVNIFIFKYLTRLAFIYPGVIKSRLYLKRLLGSLLFLHRKKK